MTVDEALAWARATDNERWQLLTETRDQELDRGADYVRRRAACVETLAQEVERLRADLARVTAERDALHEAAHKHHADMDVVIAERDALAKRWEAIQSHVVGVDDDACVPAVDEWDAGWSEAFSDVRAKMRELEAGR